MPNEESLYPLWKSLCRSDVIIHPKKLRGIFPGVFNRFDGPDFQGAEFELDGRTYRGDVEIHNNARDWYAHNHHLDPKYDRVVLHLVWQQKSSESNFVTNSKQQSIPTISLKYLSSQFQSEKQIPYCTSGNAESEFCEKILRKLALKRLTQKAKYAFDISRSEGFDQSIYVSLLRLLGSPQNVNNFEQISRLLPWKELQTYKKKLMPPAEWWLALFLFYAGLINQKEQFKELKKYQSAQQILVNKNSLSSDCWKFGGQRPFHSPVMRLAGLAQFVHRFPNESIFAFCRDLFITRMPFAGLYKKLSASFSLIPSTYWQNNFPDITQFWGRSLKTEIIANVLIPLLYHTSLHSSSFGFAAYLEEFFLYLPATLRYGRLKNFSGWRELKNNSTGKFFQNQALLHLQNHFCNLNLCQQCPLGRIRESH